MLAKARLLVNHVTDSLDLVIAKDENAVGKKQVVTQQEGVGSSHKHLVFSLKQSLTNWVGKFMVIDEHERGISHFFQPAVLKF